MVQKIVKKKKLIRSIGDGQVKFNDELMEWHPKDKENDYVEFLTFWLLLVTIAEDIEESI